MIIRNRFYAYHITGLFGDLIALDTLTAAILEFELIHIRALAHAVFGDDQQTVALMIQLHADDLIAVFQRHTDDTHGRASRSPHIGLPETDAHAVFGHQEDLTVFICLLYLDELVILPQIDGI